MSGKTFDIVFHGVIAPGADAAQVKKSMAALFKTEAAKVEPLFSGKRFVIKKGLDQTTAQRYQKALREIGAIVEIAETVSAPATPLAAKPAPARATVGGVPPSPMARATAAPTAKPAPSTQGAVSRAPQAPSLATDRRPTPISGVTIAPPGAVLVAPEKVEPLQVDTSRLTLDKPGVVLVQHPVVPDLKVNISGLSMAAAGAILREPEALPDLKVDTSRLTMAEPGVTLVAPEKVAVPVIDTSKISLA